MSAIAVTDLAAKSEVHEQFIYEENYATYTKR